MTYGLSVVAFICLMISAYALARAWMCIPQARKRWAAILATGALTLAWVSVAWKFNEVWPLYH